MWRKDQAKAFVKQAKQLAGPGWSLLGPELREGLVAREFALVLIGQGLGTLDTEGVRHLYQMMLEEAGLAEK